MSVTEQAEAALPSIIIFVLTSVLRWRCDARRRERGVGIKMRRTSTRYLGTWYFGYGQFDT